MGRLANAQRTDRMSRGAGIHAPSDGRLVRKNILGVESHPVARERAVVGMVLERDGSGPLLKALDEATFGIVLLFRQLSGRVRSAQETIFRGFDRSFFFYGNGSCSGVSVERLTFSVSA